MLDDAVLVDHECRPRSVSRRFVVDAVVLNGFAMPVAQQRKLHADIFREALVGRRAVHTNSENLSVCLFEFGDISLIRFQFFRSTTGKGEHIKREYHVFRAFEVVQINLLTFRVGKGEVGGGLAHL